MARREPLGELLTVGAVGVIELLVHLVVLAQVGDNLVAGDVKRGAESGEFSLALQ